MKALKKLIGLEQSTSKAIPFKEWSAPPEIHFECPDTENKYNLYRRCDSIIYNIVISIPSFVCFIYSNCLIFSLCSVQNSTNLPYLSKFT